MSDESFTGFTASFRPGGRDYDSPLLVVRADTEPELISKLNGDPDTDELGEAVAKFHAHLRSQFDDIVTASTPPGEERGAAPAEAPKPIWDSGPASAGTLSANPDGTYPPCPHGSKPRKPWTSPRNGKRYLFCTLDRGAPGACQSVVV